MVRNKSHRVNRRFRLSWSNIYQVNIKLCGISKSRYCKGFSIWQGVIEKYAQAEGEDFWDRYTYKNDTHKSQTKKLLRILHTFLWYFVKSQSSRENSITIFICHNYTCEHPWPTPSYLLKLITNAPFSFHKKPALNTVPSPVIGNCVAVEDRVLKPQDLITLGVYIFFHIRCRCSLRFSLGWSFPYSY